MSDPREAELITGDGTTVFPWQEARTRLAEENFYWLATVHPDGRPHVRPVLAVWVGDALHTSTNPTARKGRNLTLEPRCALTARTEGMDLVLEGKAARVVDEAALRQIGEAYMAKYGWPVTVRDGAFEAPYGAPTAGPPPYEVYAVSPEVVFGFGTDDELAPRSTRWRF